MAFGRRNRPSLARTVARTAVVAGTATAASNAVNARNQPTNATQVATHPFPAAVPPLQEAPADDLLSKLERLAALHSSGALTDAEFAAVKASIIG
ncbi:SHOCT domain-containing protein [Arthrobacter cryoconiti]|uniref:SHOCT domain-containing protein n=1 Tax=Arthrobacter cryoconiti TaxID=748907 RepID=A0ABV8R2X9_9MICC|nr:SHOCT domain-containing protein [Arthrobacter cryoconiti]MCC9068586.1 SHOCT domain-containing protein [Arthrobacter cryoconiti]